MNILYRDVIAKLQITEIDLKPYQGNFIGFSKKVGIRWGVNKAKGYIGHMAHHN